MNKKVTDNGDGTVTISKEYFESLVNAIEGKDEGLRVAKLYRTWDTDANLGMAEKLRDDILTTRPRPISDSELARKIKENWPEDYTPNPPSIRTIRNYLRKLATP